MKRKPLKLDSTERRAAMDSRFGPSYSQSAERAEETQTMIHAGETLHPEETFLVLHTHLQIRALRDRGLMR